MIKSYPIQHPEVSMSPEGRVLQWEEFETWLRCNERGVIEIISKLKSLDPQFGRRALTYNMDREKIVRFALYHYFTKCKELEQIITTLKCTA